MNKPKIPLISKEEDGLTLDESYMMTSHRYKHDDKAIAPTFKSKSYLLKILADLPAPKAFNGLIIATIIFIVISSSIEVAEYIVFQDLYGNIYSEILLCTYQYKQFAHIIDYSIFLFQIIALSK